MQKLFIRLLKGGAAWVTPNQVAGLLKYSLSVAGNYRFKMYTKGQKIFIQMLGE